MEDTEGFEQSRTLQNFALRKSFTLQAFLSCLCVFGLDDRSASCHTGSSVVTDGLLAVVVPPQKAVS